MQNGGDVEYVVKGKAYYNWDIVENPIWDWHNFEYRIKERKVKVTIEKWLIKDIDSGEYFTMESSDVDLTLKDFPSWWRVKLLETNVIDL